MAGQLLPGRLKRTSITSIGVKGMKATQVPERECARRRGALLPHRRALFIGRLQGRLDMALLVLASCLYRLMARRMRGYDDAQGGWFTPTRPPAENTAEKQRVGNKCLRAIGTTTRSLRNWVRSAKNLI
jgi:hypothetical protein